MDHEIIWSPEALEDAEEIARYARDSWYYANRTVEQFFELGECKPNIFANW